MMEVFRSLSGIRPADRSSAVAIGNFDGVHAGHRRLFRRVVEVSRAKGWRPSVLTFHPHPSQVVAPERAPKLLSSTEERWRFMEAEGIERVIVLPFDRAFASLNPEEFAHAVLGYGIHAAGVFVGENFRFGAKHAGDVAVLKRLGDELGFEVEIVPSVWVRGRMVSSTEIRNLIQSGNVSLACRLLERPYSIEGSIVSGAGIGSTQTVPTLNLQTDAPVLPADGVYITQTTDIEDARVWQSITNIGLRPTFDGQHRTVETYLLSAFDGNTPKGIRLEFLRRVRGERKFESPEALKAQIFRDAKAATNYFRRLVTRGQQRPV